MPFKYKKVLVIGATSGIGLALSNKFLDEGSSIIAIGRREQNLKDLASHTQHADKISTQVFDITNLSAIPQFIKDITTSHPDIDMILLNSGIQRHLNWQDPASVDLSLMDKEFTTNYTAYMHLTKAILSWTQTQAPRPIALVYVTSGLALVPVTFCPNYCASKAALHHMILALRLQLKEINSNVRVIELLPPAVQTELHDDKHQPEFRGKGREIGMPLEEFVEEAYEGLNSADGGREQIPVQMVKGMWGFEEERQGKMMGMYEMRRKQQAGEK